jgi:hypothetical protein
MNTQEAIGLLNYMLRDIENDAPNGKNCIEAQALTHAIEHMKRGQWQDISTAPKEETHFLCRKKNSGPIFEAYFVWETIDLDDGSECPAWVLIDDKMDDWVDDEYRRYEWMPLPEPPQERKD